MKMEVAAVVTGTRSEIRIRDDYTLVKVVGGRAESNIARLTINPGALRPGRLLYLAGYFPTLNLRHRPKSARDVRNNFRVSTPWTCFSSKVENRCLYHGCQARSGVSGAPLVQIAQNGLSLVGIHVGPSGNGRGCDDKDESGRGGNVAVVLPDKVSDIIQRNDQDDVEGDYWSTHKMNKWYK